MARWPCAWRQKLYVHLPLGLWLGPCFLGGGFGPSWKRWSRAWGTCDGDGVSTLVACPRSDSP
eukprot:11046252-Alexandrium_andersonii.AAC.1